jgi:flagellar biosynthetic protein FliR
MLEDLLRLPMILPSFAIVVTRITGIVLSAPFFGSPVVPGQVRGFFVVAASAMIFPMVRQTVPPTLSLGQVVVGLAGELSIGLVIGLGFALVFAGASIAARLVGQQAGLARTALFDPVFQESSTAIGEIYFFFTLLVFFAIGGHHALVICLLDTFRTAPPMTFTVTPSIVDLLNDLVTAAFSFGLRMAAPVLIATFLASMSLQFINRTMQQLNILSVGFAIRVLVGIWIIAAGIGSVAQMFAQSFWDFADRIANVVT